jgi:hypothetical protein
MGLCVFVRCVLSICDTFFIFLCSLVHIRIHLNIKFNIYNLCNIKLGLVSSAVDRGFESWLGQTEDYKIGICCFSAKHAALRRKKSVILNWEQKHEEWVSDCCLMPIFQLYHDENKLIFNEMMMRSALY